VQGPILSTPGNALRNNLEKLQWNPHTTIPIQIEKLPYKTPGRRPQNQCLWLRVDDRVAPPPFKSMRMPLEFMSIWGILERWTHLPHSMSPVLPEALELRSYGAWLKIQLA